jgi:hypothetical protein
LANAVDAFDLSFNALSILCHARAVSGFGIAARQIQRLLYFHRIVAGVKLNCKTVKIANDNWPLLTSISIKICGPENIRERQLSGKEDEKMKRTEQEPFARSKPIPIDLEDEVRRRAYEIYEQHGGTSGSDVEDWLQAEAEILDDTQRLRKVA